MRNVITILILLLPLCALSQSREADSLYMEGTKLFDAQKYNEAVLYFQKCVALDKATLPPTSENYHRAELKIADCWDEIAAILDDEGKYQLALNIEKNVVETRKKYLGTEDTLYANALNNLAYYYDEIGNYAEAIRLGTIAMEINKKVLGEEHPKYATSLNNLASVYDDIGNLAEAIKLTTIATKIRKKVLGEEHPDYAISLSNLAYYLDKIGNTSEAIRLTTIAMEIRKKVLGEENTDYALSLNNLAIYHCDLGNYAEAIRLLTIATEIYKKKWGEKHPDYAISLSNLAQCHSKIGNLSEAIKLENIALEIRRTFFGENHPDFAISLNKLALYNYQLGNYSEAIRLEKRVKGIHQKAYGEKHPEYSSALRDLAKYNLYAGKHSRTTKYYKHGYARTSAFIMKNFSWMTSKDRMSYWKNFSDFYDQDLPHAAYKTPKLAALTYNGMVFSKGLLLNAELELQNLIEQSGDTALAYSYTKIKSDRANLDELYATPLEERTMNADSLLKTIERAERRLLRACKKLGDFTCNLTIDWRDIQKKLKDGELAIEFANFKDTSKQDIYIALVLKKGMSSPEIVKIFESDEFATVKVWQYYRTSLLYNLIWKPLEKYLDGVKTVYFSPAGRLHSIGIEYLSDENGNVFAEKYDTYRLSSTRELAMHHTDNPNKNAATFGGIQYDVAEDDIEENSIAENNKKTGKKSNGKKRNSGNAEYLADTKIESEAVAQLLLGKDYNVTALSDTLATEESIKKLSGSHLKILHISTHGFYINESDMENIGYKFYTSSQQSDEDKALSCSGLLFAGANAALDIHKQNLLTEGADDGVLTAREISRLDFRGLDLVILSACKTGLGEVTGDGVFGLQRGFKKAGAQTMIMSLWDVFDKSTKLLMVEFFRNLTSGMSKRAAFIAAQNVVRTQYPDPVHWAAFVMVDGI